MVKGTKRTMIASLLGGLLVLGTPYPAFADKAASSTEQPAGNKDCDKDKKNCDNNDRDKKDRDKKDRDKKDHDKNDRDKNDRDKKDRDDRADRDKRDREDRDRADRDKKDREDRDRADRDKRDREDRDRADRDKRDREDRDRADREKREREDRDRADRDRDRRYGDGDKDHRRSDHDSDRHRRYYRHGYYGPGYYDECGYYGSDGNYYDGRDRYYYGDDGYYYDYGRNYCRSYDSGRYRSSYVADMTGDQEVPQGPRGAEGTANVDLDLANGRVCYRLAYDGIDGPTAARIHRGVPGVAGPVVVDLGPADSGHRSCVQADRQIVRDIEQHPRDFYVNLHTPDFPAGAMRGQLIPTSAYYSY